jgi:predicted DNA-binding transcriptional regulator AlpA
MELNQTEAIELKPIRYITTDEVLKRMGISKTFFFNKLVKQPDFPKPKILGGNRRMWRFLENEIDLYMLGLPIKH